ncbi:unnamed protein product [Protopolystoma xenopodis]|uniref:Uncharacterized protein n=1 Tax=Protopolystoma xenopodis TaxID=117903 RepID=A0A3S5AY76_9PLAT|nr:unnamed protein product [Protopolystoma xenopodis]
MVKDGYFTWWQQDFELRNIFCASLPAQAVYSEVSYGLLEEIDFVFLRKGLSQLQLTPCLNYVFQSLLAQMPPRSLNDKRALVSDVNHESPNHLCKL